MREHSRMGFNRRKMDDERRRAAEKKAAEQRATDPQIVEDAERLIAVWNERQKQQMPMLFSPTISAAIAAGYWFLWVRCPACRTINACARSIVTTMRPSRVSFRRCPAARVDRTRRLPNSCGYRAKASPTKCGRKINGACLVTNSKKRPRMGARGETRR